MLNKKQKSVKVRKGITNNNKCLHNLLLKGELICKNVHREQIVFESRGLAYLY
jgi:hypothetical protein